MGKKTSSKPEPNRHKVRHMVRIKDEQFKALSELAETKDRSVTKLIEYAVKEYLQREGVTQ